MPDWGGYLGSATGPGVMSVGLPGMYSGVPSISISPADFAALVGIAQAEFGSKAGMTDAEWARGVMGVIDTVLGRSVIGQHDPNATALFGTNVQGTITTPAQFSPVDDGEYAKALADPNPEVAAIVAGYLSALTGGYIGLSPNTHFANTTNPDVTADWTKGTPAITIGVPQIGDEEAYQHSFFDNIDDRAMPQTFNLSIAPDVQEFIDTVQMTPAMVGELIGANVDIYSPVTDMLAIDMDFPDPKAAPAEPAPTPLPDPRSNPVGYAQARYGPTDFGHQLYGGTTSIGSPLGMMSQMDAQALQNDFTYSNIANPIADFDPSQAPDTLASLTSTLGPNVAVGDLMGAPLPSMDTTPAVTPAAVLGAALAPDVDPGDLMGAPLPGFDATPAISPTAGPDIGSNDMSAFGYGGTSNVGVGPLGKTADQISGIMDAAADIAAEWGATPTAAPATDVADTVGTGLPGIGTAGQFGVSDFGGMPATGADLGGVLGAPTVSGTAHADVAAPTSVGTSVTGILDGTPAAPTPAVDVGDLMGTGLPSFDTTPAISPAPANINAADLFSSDPVSAPATPFSKDNFSVGDIMPDRAPVTGVTPVAATAPTNTVPDPAPTPAITPDPAPAPAPATAAPAAADTDTDKGTGQTRGGVVGGLVGATLGGFLGGPIGGVIGALGGRALGNAIAGGNLGTGGAVAAPASALGGFLGGGFGGFGGPGAAGGVGFSDSPDASAGLSHGDPAGLGLGPSGNLF